jgi:hypothetical protein
LAAHKEFDKYFFLNGQNSEQNVLLYNGILLVFINFLDKNAQQKLRHSQQKLRNSLQRLSEF